MKRLSRRKLLKCLESSWITVNGSVNPSQRTVVGKPDRCSRFWQMPSYVGKWPFFLASVLLVIPDWDEILLWPKSGKWPPAANDREWDQRVCATVLKQFKVPVGWNGGLSFGRAEIDQIVTILFINYAFQGCIDDLLLVTTCGRVSFLADHHGVIHVAARSLKEIKIIVDRIEQQGYLLPRKVPDATFLKPSWMRY